MSAKYESEKFIVINTNDLRYLTDTENNNLLKVLHKVKSSRMVDNKSPNKYYVCNQDEPYAKYILDIILHGEDSKLNNVYSILSRVERRHPKRFKKAMKKFRQEAKKRSF